MNKRFSSRHAKCFTCCKHILRFRRTKQAVMKYFMLFRFFCMFTLQEIHMKIFVRIQKIFRSSLIFFPNLILALKPMQKTFQHSVRQRREIQHAKHFFRLQRGKKRKMFSCFSFVYTIGIRYVYVCVHTYLLGKQSQEIWLCLHIRFLCLNKCFICFYVMLNIEH